MFENKHRFTKLFFCVYIIVSIFHLHKSAFTAAQIHLELHFMCGTARTEKPCRRLSFIKKYFAHESTHSFLQYLSFLSDGDIQAYWILSYQNTVFQTNLIPSPATTVT